MAPPRSAVPKRLHEFVAHTVQVNAVAVAPSHRLVATGGDDNIVNVWRVDNASNVASLAGHTSPVMCLAIDPASEHFVAAGSEGGSIKVFDMASGKLARSLTGHAAGVTCLNYDSAANMLISGSMDASFKMWDVRTKKCIMHHKGHSTEVTDAQISPDGRWCCSSGKDGVMNLWDLRDRETIYSFELETKQGKPSPILHFNFHPTLPMLATSTADRSVRLFDTDSFELLASSSFPGETSPASAMAFDGHGFLYTATTNRMRVLSDTTLEVLGGAVDAPWGNNVATLSCHDGQLLAAGVRNNVVSLYTSEVGSPPVGAGAAAGAAAAAAAAAAVESTQARAAVAAREEGDTHPPQDNTAFTPSRLTRSVARRASLLSPPPAAAAAASAGAPAEGEGGEGKLAPPSQQPQKSAAATVSTSTSTSSTSSNNKQQQHDKENQSSSSSSRPAAGAATAKASSTTTTTSKKDELPLDPQARLSRADDEIIAGTLLHRKVLMGALSARLTHLQRLAEVWKKGRVSETFQLLHRLHEATPEDQGRLTVLADFLQAIDLVKCAKECGPNTLEMSTPLLPVLASLLALDFEGHVLAGLKTMTALLALFGEDVRQILRMPVGAGVDLSREKRVKKCRVFHKAMQEAQGRVEKLAASRAFKGSSPVHAAVEKAQVQLGGYLKV